MKRLMQFSMTFLIVLLLSPQGTAHAQPQGATITVNTENDEHVPDDGLSLREAIGLANGDFVLCFTTKETQQAPTVNWVPAPYPSCGVDASTYPRWNVAPPPADPGVGKNAADHIVFTNMVGTINVTSPLPIVGQNDNIDGSGGSGGKVTINGAGAGSGDGLVFCCSGATDPTSNQVMNLVIRNFPGAGIRMDDDHANGVTLQGLEIHDNGSDGIHVSPSPYGYYNPRNMQIGGSSVSQRNFIYANGGNGIVFVGTTIGDTGSNFNNHIENTYIGVKPDGSTQAANTYQGIYFQDMLGNTIGGANPLQGNVISGNGQHGIYLTGGGSTGNAIQNNIVGLNAKAIAKVGNGYSGIVLVNGAHDNTVANNLIAGNGNWGLYIGDANSNHNVVTSNYLGTNTLSAGGLGNDYDGVYVTNGAQSNQIGVSGAGNVVVGSGGDGVKINGSGADYNTVRGNTIGLNATQSVTRGNTYNGVTIAGGAQHNIIGGSGAGDGNVIAGNGLHGIGMYDANTNANGVYSNTIGTNPSSAGGLGNGGEGVHLENGPSNNVIGLSGEGNLISGNAHDGVQLGGSGTNSNLVYNNTIGLSANQASALPNGYSGVAIFGGASTNLVGFSGGNGNVIAGNHSWGIYIANAGTNDNSVYANFIGTNPAGAGGLGNGYDGIVIFNGAAYNTVGDLNTALGNTIAGNAGVGIAIGDAGTTGNAVLGNAIGWFDLFTPRPNAMGIRLTGGTTYNNITGNFIAGNVSQGIGLYNTGTTSNTVQLNIIGGTILTPMGNGMNGVVIQESASANTVDQNLIISNGQNGVYVNSAATMNNVISNNRIGTSNGGPGLGNAGRGILFDSGATSNSVLSGTIAYNNGGGIAALPGSSQNTFLRLNEFSNTGLGIDLLNPAGVGCTDGAGGGNHCVLSPVIDYAAATVARGSGATSSKFTSVRIDVYVSNGDPSDYGEGRYWLTSVTTNGFGNWTANLGVNICGTYGSTAKVTATQTVPGAGTSEFARNFPACNKLYLPLVER